MKKQTKIIALAMFLGSSALHAGGSVPIALDNLDQKEEASSSYVFGSIGAGTIGSVTPSPVNAAFSGDALDDSVSSFEMGIGYKLSEFIFAELAYQKMMLEIADVDMGYASINYSFGDADATFRPYVGALAGLSQLKWSTDPHIVHINKDLTSESFVYGAQLGADYRISKHLSLRAKYQYVGFEHILDVQETTSTLTHENAQTISLGVKYDF